MTKSDSNKRRDHNPYCDATCHNYCLHEDFELKKEMEDELHILRRAILSLANMLERSCPIMSDGSVTLGHCEATLRILGYDLADSAREQRRDLADVRAECRETLKRHTNLINELRETCNDPS